LVNTLRKKRSTAELFNESPQLRKPTARIAKQVFIRFLLVAVSLNAMVGLAVVAYDVADYYWTTKEHLANTGAVISKVAIKLRAHSDKPDTEVLKQAADLTQAPMALLDFKGKLSFASTTEIEQKINRVFPGPPPMGTRVVIDKKLDWLSGAWVVSPFSKQHNLLAVAIRHPEAEGLAMYMTKAAGLIGLGLALSFLLMLVAANWMLRHPLHHLVDQLSHALGQSERQLLQSAKMATLGEMATGVAHELNQPLNNIGLLCTRMGMRLGDLDQKNQDFYGDKLDKIKWQVNRAGKIIEHLRPFGRPTSRRLENVDVITCIRAVAGLMDEQLRGHDIKLELKLSGPELLAIADQGQLEQVLMNLLVNARDACDTAAAEDEDKQRSICMEAARTGLIDGGTAICIQVTDNGCGMTSDVQARVFDPFFSTKDVGKGTGLGLSISYGLVRDFGGTMEVESVHNRGSQFTIWLKEGKESSRQSEPKQDD